MKMPDKIESEMIAVCGVYFTACSAYLNTKNPCPGCRAPKNEHTRKSCKNCLKKECAFEQSLNWCFECEKFPCSKIKSLNKRYMENYNIDLVQNGIDAKSDMEIFLDNQRKRFTCDNCGGIIDQHSKICSENCNHK